MDMTVPEQVQRQMEDAAKLHQQVYGEKAAPAPVAENTPTPEPTEAPALQEAAPEPSIQPAPPAVSDETFEQKYKIIEGKYRSEVPRLHQQLREQSEQMQKMQEQLELLTRKQEEKPVEPEKSLVTDKDVEDFGTDLVDMVRRAATEIVRKESAVLAAALDKRFAQFMQQLGAVQEKVIETEQNSFWGAVVKLVPDWNEVDQNESWVEFLNSRIPGTRKTRREEAAEAIAAGDPEPIKELVDIWRSTQQPAPAASQPTPSRRQELQQQVTPSTAKNSAPPSAPRVFTSKDYEYAFSMQAMHDLPAERLAALQSEMQVALAEGRVRW